MSPPPDDDSVDVPGSEEAAPVGGDGSRGPPPGTARAIARLRLTLRRCTAVLVAILGLVLVDLWAIAERSPGYTAGGPIGPLFPFLLTALAVLYLVGSLLAAGLEGSSDGSPDRRAPNETDGED